MWSIITYIRKNFGGCQAAVSVLCQAWRLLVEAAWALGLLDPATKESMEDG